MNTLRTWSVGLIVLLLLNLSSGVLAQEQPSGYKIVGYYTSYDIYTEDYFVNEIPVDLLTHLNYAYIDVSEHGQCVSSDEWADKNYAYADDSSRERLRGNFKQLQLLRQDQPNLKINMTIGGWEHSTYFSEAAQTPESRSRLARSCIAFMREYNFDGIDIDWRYPVSGGSEDTITRPEDSENFTLLLAEFRTQLDETGAEDEKAYTLTIAGPAVENLYDHFQLDRIHSYLDWINLTAYGFEGSWSKLASHHAPLFANPRDPRGETAREQNTVAGAVNAYLDAGVPAEKIVVGISLYAQAWRNVAPNELFGLYQLAEGAPTGTRSGGLLYYKDLQPLLESQNYIRFFDEEAQASWMYNSTSRVAISYESVESILSKIAYVKRMQLGGVMVWELSYDDSAHTLLKTIYEGISVL